MVAGFSAYYCQLLVVYVLVVGGSGIVGGLYARYERRHLHAERRRLEYVVRRYNRLHSDNYDPFEG